MIMLGTPIHKLAARATMSDWLSPSCSSSASGRSNGIEGKMSPAVVVVAVPLVSTVVSGMERVAAPTVVVTSIVVVVDKIRPRRGGVVVLVVSRAGLFGAGVGVVVIVGVSRDVIAVVVGITFAVAQYPSYMDSMLVASSNQSWTDAPHWRLTQLDMNDVTEVP